MLMDHMLRFIVLFMMFWGSVSSFANDLKKCAAILLPEDRALLLSASQDHLQYQKNSEDFSEIIRGKNAFLLMAKLALKAPRDVEIANHYLAAFDYHANFESMPEISDSLLEQRNYLFQIFAAAKVIAAQPKHPLSVDLTYVSLALFLEEAKPTSIELSEQAKETFDAVLEAFSKVVEVSRETFLWNENRENVLESWNLEEFPWENYINLDGTIKRPTEFNAMNRFRMMLKIPSSKIEHPLYLKYLSTLSN